MKLAKSSQTVINGMVISLLLLTFAARPLLAHSSKPHRQPQETPSFTSQTAEPEQQSQRIKAPVKSKTSTEQIEATVSDEHSMTSQEQTLMPTGLGESIFVLLIGTPLGLFFLKQGR
ncbi:MAG: hypothetical protein WA919_10760 [Coleofasciculaceae cyanobacterium]